MIQSPVAPCAKVENRGTSAAPNRPATDNTIAALEAFSYTVSHDLRTPLRSIRAFAAAFHDEYINRIDGAGQHYLERIIHATERMESTINDVLEYSRAVSSGIAFEQVRIDPIIEQVIQDLQTSENSQAKFTVMRPLPVVLGTQCLLNQCISNILSNAVKFAAAGRTPRIHIWSLNSGPKIRLFIKDNGIGISPGFRESIFKPFQRGYSQFEGTGVGLSIVKQAVARMAGQVGFDSTPGEGSTFWIEVFAAN